MLGTMPYYPDINIQSPEPDGTGPTFAALQESWIERNSAARQHYAQGKMDRREDALNDAYDIEAEMEKLADYVEDEFMYATLSHGG